MFRALNTNRILTMSDIDTACDHKLLKHPPCTGHRLQWKRNGGIWENHREGVLKMLNILTQNIVYLWDFTCSLIQVIFFFI